MVIEKLREKARRDAEAELAQTQEREQKRRRRRKGLSKGLSMIVPLDVVNHKIFVSTMAVWGAALGFLCVMMLANWTITRLTMFAGLEMLGSFARVAYALVAAVIGGAGACFAALLLKKSVVAKERAKPIASVATVASREMRPIDPSADLGSDRFDAPIEEMPFAGTDEQSGADNAAENASEEFDDYAGDDALISFEGDGDPFIHAEAPLDDDALLLDESCEVSDDAELDIPAPETLEQAANQAPEIAPPRALDLIEFAQLPGRNAVWIEEDPVVEQAQIKPVELHEAPPAEPSAVVAEPAKDPKPQDVRSQDVKPEDAKLEDAKLEDRRSAIEKLRQVPPQELSLIQMVERFAAALHENQAAAHAMATTGRGSAPNPPRDAALAEALKALSLFTERGFDVAARDDLAEKPVNMVSETERELRQALEKLQNLRGAA